MKEFLLKLSSQYPNDVDFGKKMREVLNDSDFLETIDIISKDMPYKEIISQKSKYLVDNKNNNL